MKLNVTVISLFLLCSTQALTRPSAITYPSRLGQQIWVFEPRGVPLEGHLVADWWDGSGWTWSDLGWPSPGVAVFDPAAITYLDSAGVRQLRVFAAGSNGHLFAIALSGIFGWTWFDLGLPAGATWVYSPTAITYVDAAGTPQIRVFVFGRNGHVYVDGWYGESWRWDDLGVPAGASLIVDSFHGPAPISYVDAAGVQQVRVFAIGTDGHLYADSWDGLRSTWWDLGLPTGAALISGQLAPLAYVDEVGNQQIRVFAVADTGHLVADAWSGFGWTWFDLGAPVSLTLGSELSAISYPDEFAIPQLLVFGEGWDGLIHSGPHLVADLWNGASWTWFDLGRPSFLVGVEDPNAIGYLDEVGNQQIRVFGNGGLAGRLYADAWDGESWTWFDLGP